MKELKFILKYSKPKQWAYLGIFITVFIQVVCLLTAPLIISASMDYILGSEIAQGFLLEAINTLGGVAYLKEHLWICGIIVFLVYGCLGIALYKRGSLSGIASETFTRNLRNDIYDHLQKLPFAYHKTRDSGDLIQRSTSDIEQIRRFLAGQLAEMLFAICMVSVAGGILWKIHAGFTVIALMIMPIIIVASFIFFRRVRRIFMKCDEAESEMTTVLQENLNGMRVVKAFHQEQKEIDKFEQSNQEYRNQLFEVLKSLAMFWGITDLLCFMQIIVVIGSGIFMCVDGAISLGDFFTFITYEGMMVWPMRQLGRILSDMGKLSVAIHRIEEVLKEPMEDLYEGETPNIKGHIVFNHVSFQYVDGKEPVLKDISFEILPYEKVALMGATGSGKSTLMHLLTRIYEYEGSITIDGIELRTISKHWLRKNIQIILQEPFLYSKTIYDNLHIAAKQLDEQQVYAASKTASIHDVITSFDQGYETEVGEKGVTLSGGQKQRVAIARSLLLQSPVIIFDDSLSALDSKTDQNIQEALRKQTKQLTTIMITHRTLSAMHADKIIVLEKGKIAQVGTHETLIKEKGIYQRIYQVQQEGGKIDGTER